jgi:hypothetical protein
MSDGHEVKVTGSDPVKFNFDRDEDGFYDFEDCEDLVDTINPDGIEAWNGWDDDCNDVVDDALDRRDLVTTEPNFHIVHSWDAVNDTLVLTMSAIPSQVEAGISWQFGDFTLTDNVSSDGKTVVIRPIDCEARDGTLTIYLCDQGSGPQQVTATIVDSGFTTVLTWDLDMDVWIPPPTLLERVFSFIVSPLGIVVTLVLLMTVIGGGAYAGMRLAHNRRLRDAYQAYDLKPEKFALSSEFSQYELPAAPDLSSVAGQQNTSAEQPSLPARPVEPGDDDIPPAPDFD